MDDKSLHLWRQIEGARRIGKRRLAGRMKPPETFQVRPPANDPI